MSLIRHPVVSVAETLHGRLPPLGRAFGYKLRAAATEPRWIAGTPALTKVVTGSVSGSEYADPRLYQFPTDNGNANIVEFSVGEDVDDLFINDVLTLVGMTAGEQIIVASDVAYVEQANEVGMLWGLGTFTSNAYHGFGIAHATETPTFYWRPRTGGSNLTQALSLTSGDSFTAFKGQGRFTAVTSIRVLGATTISVEMRIGNGTLSGLYEYTTPIDVLSGGTENPGYSGQTIANFRGLGIGCLLTATSGSTNRWGRGSTNVGKYDQIIGARGSYDSAIAAAVLAEMSVSNELDFPPSLCDWLGA